MHHETKPSILIKGLITGLVLQAAVGPVFFYIINRTIQGSLLEGLSGVLAVTLVDYLYIVLAICGIGKLLEKPRIKTIFSFLSPSILGILGIHMIYGALTTSSGLITGTQTGNIYSTFITVLLITLTNPLTIIFFTGLFGSKAIEYGYKRVELFWFGLGTGLATIVFMSLSVIILSFLQGHIPPIIIQYLNAIVGVLLVIYGGKQIYKKIWY